MLSRKLQRLVLLQLWQDNSMGAMFAMVNKSNSPNQAFAYTFEKTERALRLCTFNRFHLVVIW